MLRDCRALGALAPVAEALVLYARSLGATEFIKKGQRFVGQPNFVTFEVHHQRANNLTISLRGNPSEFLADENLPARKSQNGYSEIKVTAPEHLRAAANHIHQARIVYDRGRTRVPKKPKLVET